MTLPHEFKRIRLNLARSKEYPSGSDRHGYEFVAPLDARGHIDPKLWQQYREQCGVRRFWDVPQADFAASHELSSASYYNWKRFKQHRLVAWLISENTYLAWH